MDRQVVRVVTPGTLTDEALLSASRDNVVAAVFASNDAIGIAWLVIVAAEMLVGGTGIGYYVWNEWNNLDLTSVIFSILMIGIVGMMLDAAFGALQRVVAYAE